jgi:CheY-like chemotaxis protein
VFRFSVRLRKDEATGQFPEPQLLFGKNVLIVDDNATNREIVRHQLESWQMPVVEACSGGEALEMLAAQAAGGAAVDLVLLDMHMPGMNGMQLAQAIRHDKSFGDVPLVMLSSLSSADTGRERYAIELDAWLTKPVRQARLHESLVAVFSKVAVGSGTSETASRRAKVVAPAPVSLRVLLAEDNPVNRLVATGMLDALGHETSVASNGHEAFVAFQAQAFDLVLMDCRMPEMDGYAATRSIRQWERDRDRKRTRIVALTANAVEGDRELCIAAGMDDYVTKPFTLEQLQKVTASVEHPVPPARQSPGATGDADHSVRSDATHTAG